MMADANSPVQGGAPLGLDLDPSPALEVTTLMQNGQNHDLGLPHRVDQAVRIDLQLAHKWLSQLGEHAAALREIGQGVSRVEDALEEANGVLRGVSGHILGGLV
jgi:hypothetical protein